MPLDIFFFVILLIFASFLQTYYNTYLSRILSFCFYLLQISFYIYLFLALLIFIYYFYNNLLLYLVLFLCFFDNKWCYSFFIYNEKQKLIKQNYKTLILSFRLELFIMLIASFLLIYQKLIL